MSPSIVVVIPTYGHFDYAANAVKSVLANTKVLRPYVVVVDDASPELTKGVLTGPRERQPKAFQDLMSLLSEHSASCFVNYFTLNGGLTRSWNYGLAMAELFGHDYACVTNSDVYFPEGWDIEIVKGLEKYALVGPITNAPGTELEQYVGKYSVTYDKEKVQTVERIQAVQTELHSYQAGRFKETDLNGFCLVAKTETWVKYSFDTNNVFRPRNDFNSKGEVNPTPLMTLNEYELQQRWRQAGLKFAACLGSYVFHYRAVSRGDNYRRGDWARLTEGTT